MLFSDSGLLEFEFSHPVDPVQDFSFSDVTNYTALTELQYSVTINGTTKVFHGDVKFSSKTVQGEDAKMLYFRNLSQNVDTGNCIVDTLTLLPPANEVWGKVMFSQVFVCAQGMCLPLGPGGVYLSLGGVPLGLGVSLGMCGVCLWVWGCSHLLETHTSWTTPPPPPRSSSGQYTSYWIALLF